MSQKTKLEEQTCGGGEAPEMNCESGGSWNLRGGEAEGPQRLSQNKAGLDCRGKLVSAVDETIVVYLTQRLISCSLKYAPEAGKK